MTTEDFNKLSDADKRIVQLESELRKLPISEILLHHGVILTKLVGSEKYGYCPFHPDSTPGSFLVNDAKGICKCFACGKGGTATKFLELTENLNHAQAVLQLACDEKIIGKSEFEILSNRAYSDKLIKKKVVNPFLRKKKEKPSEYIAMANNVYSLIAMKLGLSEEDQQYLKNERHIQDDHLKNYFTIDHYNQKEIIRDILKVYPEYQKTLKDLAGFFEESDKLNLTMPAGIGILIRNAKGYIVGIQVRKKTISKGEQRYTWVTSNFALYSKYCKGGASPGAPIDVLVPSGQNIQQLAIVEGRFKSEILSEIGFASLSVQGVGNYLGIEKEIEVFPNVKRIYVFYDADMLHNTAVLNQAIKLGEYLNLKCPNITIQYCIWHEELGKGIDDLVLTGHKSDVRRISQDTLAETFNNSVFPLMKKHGISSSSCKLTKEQRLAFDTELKEILVSTLFKQEKNG